MPATGCSTCCAAVAFAAVVVAGALGRPHGTWHRVSARGVLPWVGLVSYSLYLWHEPLLLHLAGNGLLPAPSPAAFLPSAAVVVAAGPPARPGRRTGWSSSRRRTCACSCRAVPSRELSLERRRAL